MVLTAKEKADIKRQGYANTGGIPRSTYWTPDGREIQAIPSLREFNRKDDDGNVIGSGTRDANLDKGWLLAPPVEVKPYCEGCDKWHDTEGEVTQCVTRKQESAQRWDEWAKKEKEGEAMVKAKEMEELKVEVLELKGMIYELTQSIKEK